MQTLTPSEQYAKDIKDGKIKDDETQQETLKHLQQLHNVLINSNYGKQKWFSNTILRRNKATVRGIYIWGGVGRGKTYLMDLFFESTPIKLKNRQHFHRFMQSIHQQLKNHQNTRNPLVKIGKEFASKYRLLCLDEFFVLDIGDAVILSRLLHTLVDNDVAIVMTSNTKPDNLYLGGLQRDRFLPAIKLINTQFDVVELRAGIDYRLQSLSGKTLFYDSLNDETAAEMEKNFNDWCVSKNSKAGISILGRDIRTIRQSEELVWFDFFDICDGPRSKADYIEIANLFKTVMISGIPVLNWEYENQTRRFIELIDELYDRGIYLIASAATGIDSLYTGKRLVNEFKRTRSRLHEMQTEHYLSRIHAVLSK